MTTTSEIKALTLNTKTVFSTTAALDRVKIHNNSSMYLQVYYGADAPNAATDPGWHETIDPGDKPVCGIVGNSAQTFTDRTFIQSTPFQGVITVMPFLPAGQLLQSGGIISGGAFCHITGYYPGEFAESSAGDEAYVQAAKQGRYQSVTGAVERYIGNLTQLASGAGLATASGAAFFTLTPARCPGLFAWAAKVRNTAQDITNINVHFYGVQADWGRGAAAASAVNWHVEAVIRNAADTLDKAVETLGIYNNGDAFAAPVAQKEHIVDQPSHPALISLSVFGPGLGGLGLVTGDIFRIRFIIDGNVGTWTMALKVDVLIDELNQSGHMDRPYVPVIYAAPSDAPYDPNGNPQTW